MYIYIVVYYIGMVWRLKDRKVNSWEIYYTYGTIDYRYI